MSTLFHIQASETDAHYLSGPKFDGSTKKKIEESGNGGGGGKKDNYSRNCENNETNVSFILFLNYYVHRTLYNFK